MGQVLAGIGAVCGLFGVALGAFAAHGLKSRLSPEMLAIFETGVRYHMYHALALVLIGLFAMSRPSATATAAGFAMLGGIVVFSGSLYLLAATETRWLGAITPIGGLAFLAGWGLLAAAAFRG